MEIDGGIYQRGGVRFRAKAGLGSEVGNLDVFEESIASVQITWKPQKSLIYCIQLITAADVTSLSYLSSHRHARAHTWRANRRFNLHTYLLFSPLS